MVENQVQNFGKPACQLHYMQVYLVASCDRLLFIIVDWDEVIHLTAGLSLITPLP